MKIIIMDCCNKSLWYKEKIGKVYPVTRVHADSYLTKDGGIKKTDAEVIEK